MNALVRKEIRLVWGEWVAALCLAVLPQRLFVYGPDTWRAWLFFFGLGAVILCKMPLGRELSLGTFSNLLAQPVERRRLWRVKLSVLAAALGSLWAGFVFSSPMRAFQWAEAATWDEVSALAGLLALLAFSGGLWTTLLLRHTVAAVLFTVMVPLVISMAILGVLDRYPPPTAIGTCCVVLVLYAILGIVGARRLFLRAQDTQWTGGDIALPVWRRKRALTSSAERKPPSGPLRVLVGKELQLHQATLLVAGVLAVVHLGAIAALKLGAIGPGSNFRGAVEGFWMLWLALPWMAGSAAVAEERRLGTLEAHLCLPVSRRRQCLLKFSVVLALGVLLGAAVPWLLEGLRTGAGAGAETGEVPVGWPMLAGLAAASTLIALLSFYASSLTRNTVEALGTSVLMTLGGFVVVGFLASGPKSLGAFQLWSTPLVAIIGWPTMLLTVAWLAARNFKHLRPGGGVWLRDFFTLAAALVVTMALSTALYFRAWEWLTPAESGHGAARIPRSGVCKLEEGGQRGIAVLLPDGRLWLGQWTWRRGGWLFPAQLISPGTAKGRFVTVSNWTDVATSSEDCVGIQSDGSLWRLSGLNARPTATPLESDRIGHGNDWKAVTAGLNHFLALRKDGTLWAWGADNYGQLGDGQRRKPAERVLAPAQVGSDPDWTAVFASGYDSFAVKSDGSLWRWGLALIFTKNPNRLGTTDRPARWEEFPKERLVSLRADGSALIAVNEEGTMFYPFFKVTGGRSSKPDFVAQMVRLRDDWKEAALINLWYDVAALKQDGSLWRWNLQIGTPRAAIPVGEPERLSRHSDWVALSRCEWATLALAADGGLWLWPEYSFDANALLRPSRRPHQIANIFE